MQVEGDVLQAALARAILDSVPSEMQKEVFRKALEAYLFHKDRVGETSPVQHAFKMALDRATQDLAMEVVNEPENRERIKQAFRESFDQMLSSGEFTEKAVQKMVGSLRW